MERIGKTTNFTGSHRIVYYILYEIFTDFCALSDETLLTIGEAARLLGVSEPALRQWTDEGQIKAFVTPGGHRRYLKTDLKRFIGANQKRLGAKSLTERFDETATLHRQIGASFFQPHAGAASIGDTSQNQFGSLGRRLLNLLTQCVTRPTKHEETVESAIEIGREYGRLTLALNMPLVEAVTAFVQHRQPLLAAIFDMMKKGEVPPRQVAEAIPLVDRAIDAALVALVAEHQQGVTSDPGQPSGTPESVTE
jgi:excisionase family DNA binding protein